MPSHDGRKRRGRCERELRILSANLQGFHVTVGELTRKFVHAKDADIVFVSKTFLNPSVPADYGQIKGYSAWIRKDSSTEGGIAFCHKASLNVVVLDISAPAELEVIMLKVVDEGGCATLCVGCHRPPSQGKALLVFLEDNVDRLMIAHQCSNVIILGGLNTHGVMDSFNSLLATYDLQNHTLFPTHQSGLLVDPLVTSYPSSMVQGSPLGPVGSSDHEAVLIKITVRRPQGTLWQWEKTDWGGLQQCLAHQDWNGLLQGDVDQQVEQFTKVLLEAQSHWVPHTQYRTGATDQPWFGSQCNVATRAAYTAWLIYKDNPTREKEARYRESFSHMKTTHISAKEQWMDNEKKLKGSDFDPKQWWDIGQGSQGEVIESSIPPLITDNGSRASTPQDKVNLLAQCFSQRMTIPEPTKSPPSLPMSTNAKLTTITISEKEVQAALSSLKETKAIGPDGICSLVLHKCSAQVTGPLTRIFEAILDHKRWPRMWKTSHFIPVHKKGSRSEPSSYYGVSPLSVVGKVLEGIITERLTSHLKSQSLISHKQYSFGKGLSPENLKSQLYREWRDVYDKWKCTVVLALDVADAYNQVWHAALVERLRAAGVGGALLKLLQDYLQERSMRVMHGGQQSSPQRIEAGLPQDSMLGSLLWTLYINEIVALIPNAVTCTDTIIISECTTGQLSSILSLIHYWGQTWQVKFDPQKTQMMVISKVKCHVQPIFNGTVLAPQKEIRILGTTYNDQLSSRNFTV